MKIIKYVAAAAWLAFFTYGIISNYSHYRLQEYVVVIIVALLPFLIYFIIRKSQKKKKGRTAEENNPISTPAQIHTQTPAISATIKHQETPNHVLEDMRAVYTSQQVVDNMRIIDESLAIMARTADIDTFLSRYETTMRCALTLEQAKEAGLPVSLDNNFSKSLVNAKGNALKNVLYRSFNKEVAEINELKTKAGKSNRIEKYKQKLQEYEEEFEFIADEAYSDVMQRLDISEVDKQIKSIDGVPANTAMPPVSAEVPVSNAPTFPGSAQPYITAKKPRNVFVPIFVGAAVVFIAGLALFTNFNNTGKDTSNTNSSPSVTRSELATVMEMTDEQERVMLSLFKSCGIGELSSVKQFQVGEERTSYHIDDEETSAYSGLNNTIVVWVDNETKTVQEIYFSDETIYADGEVQGQVTDYYVSKEACSNYRVVAQMYIDQLLNYPDTAKYPNRSGWAFGVVDGFDVAQSTVTAQNAFGVSDTMQFTIKFDRKTEKVVSLILDGKEYVG